MSSDMNAKANAFVPGYATQEEELEDYRDEPRGCRVVVVIELWVLALLQNFLVDESSASSNNP